MSFLFPIGLNDSGYNKTYKPQPSSEPWNKLLGFFKVPYIQMFKVKFLQPGLCSVHWQVDISHIALCSGYVVRSVLLGFYDKGWDILHV